MLNRLNTMHAEIKIHLLSEYTIIIIMSACVLPVLYPLCASGSNKCILVFVQCAGPVAANMTAVRCVNKALYGK
jgi:hypothetical protein